jgi:hypothetical protein
MGTCSKWGTRILSLGKPREAKPKRLPWTFTLDSPLGRMLRFWGESPLTKDNNKQKGS